MIKEARIAVLLGLAKEAQAEAARTKDPIDREIWPKITESCRELAKRA